MSLVVGVEGTPAAWRVVFACFLSAVFAWGFGFYAHGIYLVELRKAHGWSTGLISSIVTGHYVLGALLLPRIADAMGRFGPRAVFLGGLAITGLALLLLPSVEAPWQLALLYAVMAPGWNATSLAPIAATVGQWFDRKRGLALNLALSGATVAGLVVAPALLAVIPRLGFAAAERLSVAIGLVVAGAAVALFVRRGPLSPRSAPAAQSQIEPLKRWHFWSISAPFAFVLVSQADAAEKRVVAPLARLLSPKLAERIVPKFHELCAGFRAVGSGRRVALVAALTVVVWGGMIV